MAYQRAANVLVALKRETTEGTAASSGSGYQLRINDSPGLELKRAVIQSNERRTDMLMGGPRLGFKTVDGSFNCELSSGGATDVLLEAIVRGTWATATAIGFSTMTTVTCGTNTVTAAAGDWIGGQGIRVGDIFTLTGYSTTANNSINARVISASSLVITVATNTFTAGAADAAGTLTILKKVYTPATPVHTTHTIEQYDADTDLSEQFLGCRLVGMKLSCKPGEMAMVSYTFMGMDRTLLAVGASPYFTTPTLTTTLGMIADDCSVRDSAIGDVTTFTAFDLDFAIDSKGEPTLGNFVTPGTFSNNMSVSGSVAGLRSDFTRQTAFDAETEFELSIMLQDMATAPKNAYGFFLPRVKLTSLSAPVGGGTGAKIQTFAVTAMPKTAATGYEGGVIKINSSAA